MLAVLSCQVGECLARLPVLVLDRACGEDAQDLVGIVWPHERGGVPAHNAHRDGVASTCLAGLAAPARDDPPAAVHGQSDGAGHVRASSGSSSIAWAYSASALATRGLLASRSTVIRS